jgi:hypothetical protein
LLANGFADVRGLCLRPKRSDGKACCKPHSRPDCLPYRSQRSAYPRPTGGNRRQRMLHWTAANDHISTLKLPKSRRLLNTRRTSAMSRFC